MKNLIVKVGSNSQDLQQISVNNEQNPFEIDSAHFRGKVVVRVKTKKPLEYFKNKSRNFSIQFSGQFKQQQPADDLVFGAVFDRKISAPYGASLAMTFANYIDPSLKSDLYCSKPWLLSPLVCAMNTLNIKRISETRNITTLDHGVVGNENTLVDILADDLPPLLKEDISWPWVNGKELVEDTTALNKNKLSASERRIHFTAASELKATTVGPEMLITGDFFGPVVDFNQFCVNLGPFSFDISSYVEGQPITFVAKSKSTDQIFFAVQFDQVQIEK